MGIYDRSYMDGSEESRYGSAAERRFSAVAVLIGINVLVWMLWQFARTNPPLQIFMEENFTCSPAGVLRDYRFHTLLTANFSHIDLFHIGFNMLFFWFLAREVELRYGRRNLYWVYFLTGLLTGLGYITVELLRASFTGISPVGALGASGCVMGVGVIAAFLDPDRPIYVFGIVRVKLKWLILFYIGADLLALNGASDGIAHAGHLGGALGGFLFYWFDLRLFGSPNRSKTGILYRLRQFLRRKPKLRVVEKRLPEEEEELVARPSRPAHAVAGGHDSGRHVDVETSRRVDELLDKIHQHGMGSLTQEEREFLQVSSEKYKRR